MGINLEAWGLELELQLEQKCIKTSCPASNIEHQQQLQSLPIISSSIL
jgi:hypothetical protein